MTGRDRWWWMELHWCHCVLGGRWGGAIEFVKLRMLDAHIRMRNGGYGNGRRYPGIHGYGGVQRNRRRHVRYVRSPIGIITVVKLRWRRDARIIIFCWHREGRVVGRGRRGRVRYHVVPRNLQWIRLRRDVCRSGDNVRVLRIHEALSLRGVAITVVDRH